MDLKLNMENLLYGNSEYDQTPVSSLTERPRDKSEPRSLVM